MAEQVYVIGCRENTLVKIGRSVDVQDRLADIQRMSPVRLRLLWQTCGGASLETRLHREFRFLRTHGEWFDFDGVDPVAAIQAALDRPSFEARAPYGPLTVPRSGLVWITTRIWEGPPIGVVVSEGRAWSRSWTYEVCDPAGRSETIYEFSPDDLRPCGLSPDVIRPGRPWPTSDRRNRRRPLVPGFGGDL